MVSSILPWASSRQYLRASFYLGLLFLVVTFFVDTSSSFMIPTPAALTHSFTYLYKLTLVFQLSVSITALYHTDAKYLRTAAIGGLLSQLAVLALFVYYGIGVGTSGQFSVPLFVVALSAFGVVGILNDGGFSKLAQGEEGDGVLTAGMWLTTFSIFTKVALYFDSEILLRISSAFSDENAVKIAQCAGLEFAVFALWRLFSFHTDKAATKSWHGIGAIFILVARVTISPSTVFYTPLGAMDLFIVFLLIEGIRRNEGVTLVDAGRFFDQARNVLLVCAVSVLLTGVLFAPAVYPTYLRVATNHANATLGSVYAVNISQSISIIYICLGFLLYATYLLGDQAAIRTALLTSVLYLVPLSLPVLSGVDSLSAAWYLFFTLGLVVLSLRAVVLSFGRNETVGSWLKSIFAWSYSPIKGGLYLATIVWSARTILKAIGAKALASPIDSLYRNLDLGFVFVIIVSVYLLTRSADSRLARAYSFIVLGAQVIMLHVTPEIRKNLGLVDSGFPINNALSVLVIAGLLASIVHDFVRFLGSKKVASSPPASPRSRGASRSPRGRTRKQ